MDKYCGLSDKEVLESEAQHGKNILTAHKPTTFWQVFWGNFDDPIIIILLVALGINVCFTFLGKVDWYECAGILLSVIIATLVSAISEYSNENTFQKIQEEAAKIKCKVYRNNELCIISAEDVVVNDIVLLQAGDIIPADGQLVSGEISVNQSALNGESKECKKWLKGGMVKPPSKLVDFWNSSNLYRGTVVCSGECKMRVDAVGDMTSYGRMAEETKTTDIKSPLTVKLSKLAGSISKFGYISAVLIVLISFFQNAFLECGFDWANIAAYFNDTATVFSDIVESVILGIIVVVVAVPEGLPLMIAIVCSLNMRKMLKANVLVRKVVGIETAGNLHILFTDKTGTITTGMLKVTDFLDGKGNTYTTLSAIPESIKNLLTLSIMENTSAAVINKKIIGGNATEKALIEYLHIPKKDSKTQRTNFIPFSSEYKFSKAYIKSEDIVLIKGAPEVILEHCRTYYREDGTQHEFINKAKITAEIDRRAKRAERILAFATTKTDFNDKIPDDLTLIGLISMGDTIRSEARNTIWELSKGGIQTVMITGDKKETASAIAAEIGLLDGKNTLELTSEELKNMSDEEVKDILPRLRVLSRALPTDKSRLVRLAQERGMVTGMTGDGVNDVPALKRADVGFAMGGGTDVTKEAGDIVILDNNFSSIKNAVLYGRTIFHSIQKFIRFQLTINVAAVAVSMLGPIVGIEKPLNISQMIWMNLMMDSLAAIAFGGEPALKRYLFEKPKKRDESIIDSDMWGGIIVDGLYISALSLFIFISPSIHNIFRWSVTDIYFYTGYFTFFVFISIFNAFNARADSMDIFENLSLNKQFLYVMGIVSVVQLFMTYYGGKILRTAGLNLREWCLVLLLAFSIFPLEFIRKVIYERHNNR